MSGKRYFEFVEGTSSKFWEVWIDGGTKVMTRYGKIGTGGQTTIKDEGTDDKAQKLFDKLVREKTGKGYAEKGGGGAPSAPAVVKKPAAPPPPEEDDDDAPTSASSSGGFRRFEFAEGDSNKFWEVRVDGAAQTVRYGKIGTAGQEKTKQFDDAGAAAKDTDKLIAEKTKKGYAEVGAAPAATKPAPALDDDEEAAEAGEDFRRFEFTDESSSKFWEIKVDGASHTVRYGTIGTAGQAKTKDFDDEDAANEDAEKLIKEKTKKGYVAA
jgi:predicted DNA-binding WGR domain protein